jgi:acyl carrier protein
MGLDAVELVMEVEERFGVRIADDEVLPMRTRGDLHDYLLEKCAHT